MPGPHVVITNVYGDDNRGGAAITAATIRATRAAWPDSETSLVSISANQDSLEHDFRHTRAAFPNVTILPAPLRLGEPHRRGWAAVARSKYIQWTRTSGNDATLEIVANADVVIGKGGQLLGRSPYGLRGSASLWMGLFPVAFAQSLKIQTGFYSVTIGPFLRRDPGRAIVASVLRETRLVMPRDGVSTKEAVGLGLDSSNVSMMPDCVFGFAPPTDNQIASVTTRFGLRRNQFVAVTATKNANRRPAGRRLSEQLVRVLNEVVSAGRIERIAVVVQAPEDLRISLELKSALPTGATLVIDEDLSPESLMALYGGAVITIGGRVHSAIFSTVAGTPVIPLDRHPNHKARDIFALAGLDHCVVDGADLSENALEIRLKATLDSSDESRRLVRKASREMRSRVLDADATLRAKFDV